MVWQIDKSSRVILLSIYLQIELQWSKSSFLIGQGQCTRTSIRLESIPVSISVVTPVLTYQSHCLTLEAMQQVNDKQNNVCSSIINFTINSSILFQMIMTMI